MNFIIVCLLLLMTLIIAMQMLSYTIKVRDMDGSSATEFIFYGNSNLQFDDYEWFKEMFLLMVQLQQLTIESENTNKVPQRTSSLRGHQFIHEILHGHPGTCYELFQMKRDTFVSLCNVLRGRYLEDSRVVRIEEAVAIFCLIVGHRQGMRVASDRFQHSTKTISRHFKHVMRALCTYGKTIIKPMYTSKVHHYISGNPKYNPWFQVPKETLTTFCFLFILYNFVI
jgi:hypothetical protein